MSPRGQRRPLPAVTLSDGCLAWELQSPADTIRAMLWSHVCNIWGLVTQPSRPRQEFFKKDQNNPFSFFMAYLKPGWEPEPFQEWIIMWATM